MYPHQLALAGPPLVLLTAGLLWLTRLLPSVARFVTVASWLVLVASTFFISVPARPVTPMLLGLPESDELWTFVLQSPEQRIHRRQRVDPAGTAELVARYVWDSAAAPGRQSHVPVMARVNGVALDAALAGNDPNEYWCCTLRWHVPRPTVAAAELATVDVWLPTPDARVRFIAQRNPGAAGLGAAGSYFFDGTTLRAGVPHTFTGSFRTGFPHVWLELHA